MVNFDIALSVDVRIKEVNANEIVPPGTWKWRKAVDKEGREKCEEVISHVDRASCETASAQVTPVFRRGLLYPHCSFLVTNWPVFAASR